MEHECVQEENLNKFMRGIRNTITWVLGSCVAFVLTILIAVSVQGTNQKAIDKQVQKITKDYAPLIVIQDIYENNDKMLQIIQMLPQTTKDDPRYIEAIRDREEFQRNALMRASAVKRGGYSGTAMAK